MQTDEQETSFSAQSKPPKKEAYGKTRRKHMTAAEVDKLEKAAAQRGRYG